MYSVHNSSLCQILFEYAISDKINAKALSGELKVLSRGAPRIFLGIQVLEQLVNSFLKALVGNPDC